MSFIGNRPDSFGYTSTAYDHFNGDGVSSTFTLSRSVTANSDIQVVVNNVIQDPGVAYYVTNLNTLVFTGIPSVGTGNITVVYRQYIMTGLGVGANTVAAQSIAANTIQPYHLASGLFTPIVDTFTANGVTSTFTLSQNAASANVCTVSVNGIIQVPPTNYSIAGKILTFTSVPANNSIVRCSQQSLVSTGTTPLDGSVVSSKLAPNLTLSGTTTLSGNLIVGTSSAMAPLTIAGAFGAANSTFNGGVTALRIGSTGSWSEPRIDLGETAVPTAYIASKNIGNGGGALIFGNRDTSSLTSTLTEKMRIDSSGNVGIGTSSPASKLNVVGGRTYLTNNDQYALGVGYGANGGYFLGCDSTNTSLVFSSGGGAERMRIDSSGNVGINTIPNTGYITGNKTEIYAGALGTTAGNIAAAQLLTSYDANLTTLQTFGYRVSTGSSHATSEWRTQRIVDVTRMGYLGYGSNYISFGQGTTEQMRIDSSGNVGIGTSSPGYKLDVTGTLHNSGGYGYVGDFNAGILGTSPSPAVGPAFSGNITGGQAESDIWNTADPTTFTNTGILFTQRLTSSTRRDLMFLHNNGNVGIGTSSPASKLNIVSATNNGILLSDGTVTTLLYNTSSSSGSVGTQSNHPFNIYSNNAVRMSFDTSGNAIIGNLNAANNTLRYLDIQNTDTGVNAGVIMRFITNNAANSAVTTVDVVKYRTGGFVIGNGDTATSNFTAFNVGVSERMRIDSSGNVGIGNASPQFRFEVDQNVVTATPAQVNTPTIYARGYAGSSTIYSGIGFAMHEHTNGYWGSAILSRDDTGSYGSALTFYTSTGSATPTPTERMRIDSSGNVGIGTTSPSVSLDVSSKTDAVGMASGTTAQRPSTPVNGYTRYNTTTNTWETYNNGGWNPLNTSIVTNYQSFTSSGTFTVPTGVRNVQVLVVGGGGGGGYTGGGGGGGGAVMFIPNYQVTPGTNITVTVGAGGAYNQNGGNSQWGTHQIAWGGGAGGSGTDRSFGQPGAPTTGASGGGGSATSSQVGSPAPGSSLGSAGGYALIQTPFPSGGGGGASQCGNAAGAGVCGAGGAGMYFQMFLSYGQSGWFGGGGGGFYPSNTAGAGGLGGGGAGQNNGTSNTGGGGGGYSSTTSNGGSGVVIVAWYQ